MQVIYNRISNAMLVPNDDKFVWEGSKITDSIDNHIHTCNVRLMVGVLYLGHLNGDSQTVMSIGKYICCQRTLGVFPLETAQLDVTIFHHIDYF